MGVGAGDVVMLASSSTFDPALGDVVATAMAGARLVCPDPAELWAGGLVREARAGSVTHVLTTPAMLRAVPQEDLDAGLGALRVVAVGGEAMQPSEVARWKRAGLHRLINVYGVTEATVYQAYRDLEGRGDESVLGRPWPGGTALEVDPRDSGLVIRGPQVAIGYLSGERFDGVFPTGDVVERGQVQGDEGVLVLRGRRDAQVKIQGARVDLLEVDGTLAGCAALSAVATVAVRDPQNAAEVTGLVAACVLKRPLPLDPSSAAHIADLLARWAAHFLPARMRPRAFALVPSLPLTATGKVDRLALSALAEERLREQENCSRSGGAAIIAPPVIHLEGCTPLCRELANIWADILDLRTEDIRGSDTFQGLGGDSLSALRVMKEIHHRVLGDEALTMLRTDFGDTWGLLEVAKIFELGSFEAWARFIEDGIADMREKKRGGGEGGGSEGAVVVPMGPEVIAHRQRVLRSQLGSRESTPVEAGPRWAAFTGYLPYLEALDQIEPAAGWVPPRHLGHNVVHSAAGGGSLEVLRFLLEAKGIRAHTVDHERRTPAHVAAQAGQAEALAYLLSRGALLEARSQAKLTIAHEAARSGARAPAVIAVLRDAGFGLFDEQDRWFRTPLHWAINNGSVPAVRALLEAGCDPLPAYLCDKNHKKKTSLPQETTLQMARRLGNAEIITMLEEAVKKRDSDQPAVFKLRGDRHKKKVKVND